MNEGDGGGCLSPWKGQLLLGSNPLVLPGLPFLWRENIFDGDSLDLRRLEPAEQSRQLGLPHQPSSAPEWVSELKRGVDASQANRLPPLLCFIAVLPFPQSYSLL